MVDTARLYASTDAAVWADEFTKAFGDRWDEGPDDLEGVMIGWFANAIETAKNQTMTKYGKY